MKYLLTLLMFAIAELLEAQVTKTTVVEHFTNTRCGTCANKNPGFYSNLDAQSDVLHITFHPSSPYNTCLFSTQNKTENDARTNYYGVFGSTPQLIINGVKISPSTDFSSDALFTPFENETSPIELKINQFKYGQDSIKAQVIVKVVATHTLPAQRLFIGLIEKEVNYASPNGENLHRDVFRKTMLEIDGKPLTLPTIIGDSLLFETKVAHNASLWNINQLYTLAILQNEDDKAVNQSAAASTSDFNGPTNLTEINTEKILVYPNPATDFVFIQNTSNPNFSCKVYTISGQLLQKTSAVENSLRLDIASFSPGVYLLEINGEWYKIAKQ